MSLATTSVTGTSVTDAPVSVPVPTSSGVYAGIPGFPVHNSYTRCLLPLLDALGWRGNHTHLIEALPHFPRDMTLVDLLNTLANLRFEGRTTPARLDSLDVRLLPCLFVPHGGGPKILLSCEGDNLLVFDGETGEYVRLPRRRLAGTVVLFRTVGGPQSILRPQPNWFRSVLARFRPVFVQVAVISLAVACLSMIAPLFVKAIYDDILVSRSTETLAWVGAGMLFFVLADTGFRVLRSYLFTYVSVRLGNIIGNEVVRRLLFLPPAFTEMSNMGSQVSRIKDFETVREFFAGPAAVALADLPFLVILMGALAAIGGRLVVVPVAAVALFALFAAVFLPLIRRINGLNAQTTSERQAFVVEMLANLRAIKQVGATGLWHERYQRLSAEAVFGAVSLARMTAAINAFSQTLVMGTGLATAAVGVPAVLSGSLSIGALATSMMLVSRVVAPLSMGFGVLTQIGRIGKSVAQVDRLMNMPLETRADSATASAARRFKGRVVFSGVSLRYSADAPPALLGVDLDAAPGETVAVVGHDGAGKTTILKLILGLYTPQAGRVILDRTNVRQFDPVVLRGQIGYVPKTSDFFRGTFAQNLLLANPAASEAELHRAAERAHVLDAILALPQGFETRIGDHGAAQLSQSLRKRLSFARAFLRSSRLLLIDEPENGLAGEEGAILETLADLKGQTTVILATHSPEFLRLADRVLWLENGRVRMWGEAAAVVDAYRTGA